MIYYSVYDKCTFLINVILRVMIVIRSLGKTIVLGWWATMTSRQKIFITIIDGNEEKQAASPACSHLLILSDA